MAVVEVGVVVVEEVTVAVRVAAHHLRREGVADGHDVAAALAPAAVRVRSVGGEPRIRRRRFLHETEDGGGVIALGLRGVEEGER